MQLCLLAVHALRLARLMLQHLTLQASSQLLLEARLGSCITAGSRHGQSMLLGNCVCPPCSLQTMLLRRTKSSTIDGQPVVNLPARETGLVKKEFDEQERHFYKSLESESQTKVLVGVCTLAGACGGQQQAFSA